MVPPGQSLAIDILRTLLIRLAPELEGMAISLPTHNPDYEDVVSAPLQLISFLCDGSENLERACQGFITFCHTFQHKQVEFARGGAYAETDFGHVNQHVYQNLEYMSKVYYPALLFSYLFSSNYFAIYRQFRKSFMPLCQSRSGAALEVGIGHGLLSASLLNSNPELVGYGLDISPAAPEVSTPRSGFPIGAPYHDHGWGCRGARAAAERQDLAGNDLRRSIRASAGSRKAPPKHVWCARRWRNTVYRPPSIWNRWIICILFHSDEESSPNGGEDCGFSS